jgi:hypothetical protein
MTRPFPYDLKVMKLTTSSTRAVSKGKFVTLSGMYIYWFVADGELTPSHGQRMWWMAKDLLTSGVLQRWAYIAYFARCIPGQEDALFVKMKNFIIQSVPEFQTTPAGDQPKLAALSTTAALPPVSAAEVPLQPVSP